VITCHPEVADAPEPLWRRRERSDEGSALTQSQIQNPKSKTANPPNGTPLPDAFFFPEPSVASQSKIQNPKSKIAPSARPISVKSEILSPCHPEERSDEGSAPVQTPKSKIDLSGSIRVASGPWSLEESWWSETPADRDYWDIELSDGALYRIYRDRKTGTWFADGIYD